MLKFGLEDDGSCDMPLGLSSGTFLGEVGDGAGGTWLADGTLIGVGRTLFVRRRPVVGGIADTLAPRACPWGCDAFTLVVRARPDALEVWDEDVTEGVRLRPVSVPEGRATEGVEIAPRASGLAEFVVL